MIVEKIENYLTGSDQIEVPKLLTEMKDAFDWSVVRQLMQPDEPSTGLRGSNPGPCARQMAYRYLEYEPMKNIEARTKITWLTGDLLELVAVGLIKLAGIECSHTVLDEEGQAEGWFDVGNGVLVPGHADGILEPQVETNDERVLLEIKSSSDYGFKFQWKNNKIGDGYMLQHQVYMDMLDIERGLFFVINKNTGHFHEVPTVYDPEYVEWAKTNYTWASAADPDNLPPRFVDGENVGRKTDKQGNKKEELCWRCRYCSMAHHCWPELKVEFNSRGKPVYKVPLDVDDPAEEVTKDDILYVNEQGELDLDLEF